MKMRVLRFLCVLCGLLVQAHAIDREAFTFTSYNLDVHIESEQQRLAVRGKITLRNDSTSPQKNLHIADFLQPGLEIDSTRRQAGPVRLSALHLGHRSHRRAFGSDRHFAPGSLRQGHCGIGNWVRGHHPARCHPADANRRARGAGPAQRLGPDRQVVHRRARHRIRGLVSGSDRVGKLVRREQRVRNGSEMEGARTASRDENQVELIPAKARLQSCCAMAKHGGLRSNEQIRPGHTELPPSAFSQPLGETVPLFVIGPYERLDQPPVNISYLPEHKTGGADLCAGGADGGPIRDRVVWRAERTS